MITKNLPDAVKSDGTKVPYETGKGYNLGIATYSIDVSMPDAVNSTVHVTWDGSAAGTVNYQDSNLPAFKSESAPYTDSSGAVDVSIKDTTNGNWIAQNMTSGAITTSSGATVSGSTLTITGGTAGGARFDIVGQSRRARIQITLSAGGVVRVHPNGKQA